MNYGILHNKRPAKTHGDDAESFRNPLLNDVRMREMAKQMGLEPKDFGGKEAMQLWKTLDKMAENDPAAYQTFIADQLKDGPPAANEDQEKPKRPRYFNPNPGYVVKCTMLGPVKQQMVELKLFLNLCSHEIVDLPKNPNSDKEVPRDPRAVPTTNNLQIPLVIGKLREIKDFNGSPCRAIDVVFHPWVLERSAWDAKFKRDVMSLAITWVQQDAKITLVSAVGKYIKSQYKGGVSIGSEIITAKFPIDPEQQQTRTLEVKFHEENEADNQLEASELHTQAAQPTKTPATVKIAMDSPLDLLKKRSSSQQNEAASEFLIAPAGTQTTPPPAPLPQAKAVVKEQATQKKLIEVIEPKSGNQTRLEEKTSKPTMKKKTPAVKRGFLNSTKASLYPDGSKEGRPPSAYVNLLSRSKVVDLNEVEQQKKQHAARQQEREEVFSFLKQDTPIASTSSGQQEEDHGDFEFERLCMEADPDLAPSGNRSANDEAVQGLFGEHIDEFAKFLTSQS